MQNHLKTARERGANRALNDAGYASIEDVIKQAEACGLIEARTKTASSPIDGLLGALKK